MGTIVLWLADGTAFFVALGLVAACLLLLLVRWKAWLVRAVFLAVVIVGVSLAILSSAPQPLWLLATWGAASVVSLVLLLVRSTWANLKVLQWCLLAIALALTVGLGLSEIRYRLKPAIVMPSGARIYVIGDSMSAGIRDTERPWPSILGDLTGFSVVNLARPAATTEGALNQAAAIPEGSCLVLVEIGGNDILGRTIAVESFRHHLDALLKEIRRKGAAVVLFELPLPPFKDDFGRIQRSLAREHGAVLIPKTVMSSVLGIDGNTLDGIHLSAKGHEAIARAVGELMVPRHGAAAAPASKE